VLNAQGIKIRCQDELCDDESWPIEPPLPVEVLEEMEGLLNTRKSARFE
jgi:hypothetical protein